MGVVRFRLSVLVENGVGRCRDLGSKDERLAPPKRLLSARFFASFFLPFSRFGGTNWVPRRSTPQDDACSPNPSGSAARRRVGTSASLAPLPSALSPYASRALVLTWHALVRAHIALACTHIARACTHIARACTHTAPARSCSAARQVERDAETLECPSMEGLFPTGEGAGYAGEG